VNIPISLAAVRPGIRGASIRGGAPAGTVTADAPEKVSVFEHSRRRGHTERDTMPHDGSLRLKRHLLAVRAAGGS
jgi:hypothetical protein